MATVEASWFPVKCAVCVSRYGEQVRPVFALNVKTGQIRVRHRSRIGEHRTEWVDFASLPDYPVIYCDHSHTWIHKLGGLDVESRVLQAGLEGVRTGADAGLSEPHFMGGRGSAQTEARELADIDQYLKQRGQERITTSK